MGEEEKRQKMNRMGEGEKTAPSLQQVLILDKCVKDALCHLYKNRQETVVCQLKQACCDKVT